MTGCDSGCDSGGLEVTHFRLDVTITSITSITSGFWPDVTLDGSLPGGHPSDAGGGGVTAAATPAIACIRHARGSAGRTTDLADSFGAGS